MTVFLVLLWEDDDVILVLQWEDDDGIFISHNYARVEIKIEIKNKNRKGRR